MSVETVLLGAGYAMVLGLGVLVVPQAAGFIVNRVCSRWMSLSRTLGAVVPFILIIFIWSAFTDDARNAGNHAGTMSGFVMLPPLHLLVAFLSQSGLQYGARHRAQ